MMVQWIRQFRPALVGLRPAFVGLSIATLIAAVILLRHPVTALVPIPLPPSIGGRDSVPASDGKYLFYPRSASVIQGVVYRFSLYTHCGLDNPVALDFDGGFWDPTGPGPASDGSANPPAGFDNPYDNGTIQLLSHDLAEYRSHSGTTVRLTRSPTLSRTTYYRP